MSRKECRDIYGLINNSDYLAYTEQSSADRAGMEATANRPSATESKRNFLNIAAYSHGFATPPRLLPDRARNLIWTVIKVSRLSPAADRTAIKQATLVFAA
jgi:hypothetical protein